MPYGSPCIRHLGFSLDSNYESFEQAIPKILSTTYNPLVVDLVPSRTKEKIAKMQGFCSQDTTNRIHLVRGLDGA